MFRGINHSPSSVRRAWPVLRERLWGHSWHFAPSQPSSIQGAGAGSHSQHWQSPISPVAVLWEAGCGMGLTCPVPGSSRATAAPRGREPPGHPLAPGPWEQGQPVQHCPLLPGWRKERGALAEPSLGRRCLAPGSQPRARSGQQELSRFLRHGRCPNCGQGWAGKVGAAGQGWWQHRDTGPARPAGPPVRVTPQEVRPLQSLPFPFIPCICTYTV